MEKILIVDDDVSVLKVLQMRLESAQYAVVAASDAREAKKRLEEETFDIALFDLRLAEGSGIDLMKGIRDIDPELPVIILTAFGTIESAVEAMKEGAYSYLTKPFDTRELLVQIRNGIEKSKLSREVKRLRTMMRDDFEGQSIIGHSEAMKRVFDAVALAAETDSNVFISGESGTGKGMVARALHQLSKRMDKPFVPINCAAIPATLLESELFGFEKGAFTGAVASKKGLFVQADKGIIFLDEISEIPLHMQGKLLKAIEEKEFYPLGSHKTVKVDVRIVSASNREIEKEVEKGTFRSDLFYRVHVVPIKVPPLRDRKEDIPILVEHFLAKMAEKLEKPAKSLSPAALQKLMLYAWPGNVRELENIIECAVVMSTENSISEDLIIVPGQKDEKHTFKPLKESKQDFERDYLVQLMKISRGNVSRASKLAGKYRADLYELLEKYHINPLDFRKD
ncbi:MAG TPA: sigma-54 dependent transcriptional regulator [Desulfobacterales bacterium]|nr:sigma-54 dependent transcriptional regulator [Desulfobacterales bacterium]